MSIYQKLLNIQSEIKVPKVISGVYLIVNPKGKVYVGSSNNIERRFYQYSRMCEKGQHKLYNSLVKYGLDNHDLIVLEYCPPEKLYERERYWGEYFGVLDRDKGLNLVLPGHGDLKSRMSESVRRKIGLAHKGKKVSFEQAEAFKNRVTGIKQTPEHINKRKMCGERNPAYGKPSSFRGKKHTPESKAYMSAIRKGKRVMGDNSNAKKVIDNKTGIIHSCAKEVALEFNINYSTLKAWLQGINKNDGRFEYVN